MGSTRELGRALGRQWSLDAAVNVSRERTQLGADALHRLLRLLASLHQALPHRQASRDRLQLLTRRGRLPDGGAGSLQPERAHALDHVADVGGTMALDLELRVFLAQQCKLGFELAHGESVAGG